MIVSPMNATIVNLHKDKMEWKIFKKIILGKNIRSIILPNSTKQNSLILVSRC